MPLGAQLLIAAVVVLWAWLVTHVALVVRVRRVREITTRTRWFVMLWPVSAAWKYGLRKHVALWVALALLYLLCRLALR